MNTPSTAEAFADKVFTAALGTMETFNLYLGERLGWFDALAAAAATPAELAERTRTNTRYAVEWLEAQAVYGNLTIVDDGGGDRLQRRYAMPAGAVVDDFRAPGDQVEQLMYGYSTLICLPDGLSSTPSEGTGTVMRRSIVTDYARRAGFTSVEVLPIEDFAFFRFYRLHH
jgi:hypothetical protein